MRPNKPPLRELLTETELKALSFRFWSKVTIGEENECWNWKAAVQWDGYGNIKILDNQFKSHRVAFELSIGPIPKKQYVCHTCDNKRCCNPSHLFTGFQEHNMRDMTNKRRHKNARLTDAEVIAIKNSTANQTLVAEDYGITQAHVSAIKTGKRWGDIK
jgi:hypothetical protein